jgi:PIN domain nuclease of toxin-antitoxin system
MERNMHTCMFIHRHTFSQIFKEQIENYASDILVSTYSVWEPLSCNAEIEYEVGFHGMM